jgi:hypothetical protein
MSPPTSQNFKKKPPFLKTKLYSIFGRKIKMACYFGHAKVLKANSNS